MISFEGELLVDGGITRNAKINKPRLTQPIRIKGERQPKISVRLNDTGTPKMLAIENALRINPEAFPRLS